MTRDLDIWIATDAENSEKVAGALHTFGGFPADKLKPSMLRRRARVFAFGREPARVDILTATDGLDFESSYKRREVVDWDGVKVPLISLEDLRLNKVASGRMKDLADLENLPPARSQKRGLRRRRKR